MGTTINTISAIGGIIGAVVAVLTYFGIKIGGINIKVSPAGFKRLVQSLGLGAAVGLVVFGVVTGAVAAISRLGGEAPKARATTSTSMRAISTTSTTTPLPTVKITSLRPRQRVPSKVSEIRGTSTRLRPGQEIWIIVISLSRYYPQDGPVIIERNGNWASPPAFIGTDRDVGRTFYVLAVLANSQAGTALDHYLEVGNQTGNYPGIKRLPAGAQEYYRVPVIRR